MKPRSLGGACESQIAQASVAAAGAISAKDL
jgi:hypothetical protein